MSFKFKFDNLLKYRRQLEDSAKLDYIKAKTKVEESLQAVEDMYNRIDEIRSSIGKSQKDGGEISGQVVHAYEFIEGQKVNIQNRRVIIREEMQVSEEKWEIFSYATKERKILEKLKDRKFQFYKTVMKKREQRYSDDLVVMRHRLKDDGK